MQPSAQLDKVDVAVLAEQHYDEVFAYLYRLLGDRAQAAALARATFLRAAAAPSELARAADVRAGLYHLATTLVLEGTNKPSTQPPPRATSALTDPSAWGEPAPVERGLAALQLRERALVLLTGRYGFDPAAAATVLGVDALQARTHLAQARRAFRVAYAPDAAESHRAFETTNRVDHWSAEDLLPVYSFLEPAEQSAVAGHFAGCASCAAELALYGRIDSDLARLPDPLTAPGAARELAATIRAGTDRDSGASGRARRARVPLTVALPLVVTLLLAVGAAVWAAGIFPRRSPARSTPTVQPAVALAGNGHPPSPTPPTPPTPAATPAGASSAGREIAEAPSSSAIAWLAGRALPIEFVEPGNSLTDLSELRDMIGQANVVLIDDNSGFGAHETQAFRQRLLEFLVERMGVRTLVLPVDWAAGEELDRYIQGAPANPLQVLDDVRQSGGSAGGVWQTQEMLYTLQWLRLHNQGVAESDRVVIRAVMPVERSMAVPVSVIQGYIWRVDPSMTFMSTGWGRQLSSYLETHRTQFEAASSPADFDHALRAAHALEQFQAVNTAPTRGQRAQTITRLLNENLAALIAGSATGGRVVVWTQGLSGFQDQTLQNLLASARRRHPPSVATLGFAFGAGSLYLPGRSVPQPTALPHAGDNQGTATRFAIYALPAAPAGTFEDYLADAGTSRYYLNLQGAPVPWDRPAWLREPPLVRSLAGTYWDCRPDEYYRRADPRATYDILVYFDRVTPVTLLYRPEQSAPEPCP